MERICFTFDIYAGKEAEYKKRHDEIWPELVTALQECGFRNYSIFRRVLTVVGYLEAHPDSATVFAKLSAYEVNAKWAEWFKDVIVNLADSQGNLMKLDEVWHLE